MRVFFYFRRVFTICLFLLVFTDGFAQTSSGKPDIPPPSIEELLKWHEVFTYEVRYSFFKLGNVKVEVVGDTLYEGEKAWYLRSIITSNPGIPFVGREENWYNSIFTDTGSLPMAHLYWRDNMDEKKYEDIRYEFDHIAGKVYVKEEDGTRDTLTFEPNGGSGHLSFLIGRAHAGTKTSLNLPIYVNGEKGYLTITNTTKMEERRYEAFDEPVQTYFSEGNTSVEGPFGFRGNFKSWYRADELRIPLEAHVRVWLGNVRIKLIDYKKELRQ